MTRAVNDATLQKAGDIYHHAYLLSNMSGALFTNVRKNDALIYSSSSSVKRAIFLNGSGCSIIWYFQF